MPGTRLRDYLGLLALMGHHPGVASTRSSAAIPSQGDIPAARAPVRPEYAAEGASADLAGAIVRETLQAGGRHMRPLVASPNLAAAFVDPAPRSDCVATARDIRFGRSLRASLRFANGRAVALAFDGEEESVLPDDRVIVAVPPWIAGNLLPGVSAPQTFSAILNAHFRIVPPPQACRMVGLVGGTAEWVFAFADRLSVTVSCRSPHGCRQRLPALLLWREVAAVHDLAAAVPPAGS